MMYRKVWLAQGAAEHFDVPQGLIGVRQGVRWYDVPQGLIAIRHYRVLWCSERSDQDKVLLLSEPVF